MENKRIKYTIKSILKVAFSNVISLAAGIIAAFVLPKIMGVSDYGYYKTFTLYASYVGLAAIGITDGIYLKYGGVEYEELEKGKISFLTRFYICVELAVSVFSCLIFLVVLENNLKFIFVCVSCYLFANNLLGYYKIVSQITCRFSELSIRNTAQSLLLVVSVLLLWAINKFYGYTPNYQVYTIIYISIIFVILVWYLFTYKDITFSSSRDVSNKRKLIFELIKLGIPLLLANLCSSFILIIDRQFVNLLFDLETYAVYAFAYNMFALITTATSAISTVIYPVLRKSTDNSIESTYPKLVEIILVFVFLALLSFYPLSLFIRWYLPKYVDSLKILQIVFPGLAINSAITISILNYYKQVNKVINFFWRSVIVLVLSIGANFLAYYLFGTTLSISIASVVIMLVWYVLEDCYFSFKYKTKWLKNFIYLIVSSLCFYMTTIIDILWVGFFVYFCLFLVTTTIFYYNDLHIVFLSICKKNKG